MLFVGDDWAEDHHDVEVQDETGRRLTKARLPEGLAGITRLHELVGAHLDEDAGPDRWWSGSRPTAARGCRRWSRRAIR
ncbi:transposase [Glutamicibacter sp. V16R2B1]|uniref:transposase n=1 Tax=Glutamicibacter sp. V16R2B1 TaxID=2036207 RepID=UPI001BB15E43|nr:transposase [Glutamicibacter sp. V16R2B1]